MPALISPRIVSALPALCPVEIIDASTGEVLPQNILDDSLQRLMDYILLETQHLWSVHGEDLKKLLPKASATAPTEWARQSGMSSRAVQDLPRDVKAKSRIDKLIQHKLVTETASYVRNPNPRKQEHSFSEKINLGAVDKQMASLSRGEDILTLLWKCWDREYLLTFKIPEYILARDIHKFSLPVVQKTSTGYVFIFTVQENARKRSKGKHTAGVDLGRKLPYVLAVANGRDSRVAHYTSSPRLIKLNDKRERLLVEAKQLLSKASAYDSLGLDSSTLKENHRLVKNKASRLGKTIAQQTGSEIAVRLAKHETNLLHVEDLSWAHGAKYGSRWVHSAQQDAIAHAAAREGVRTKKVSPRKSSQSCHSCGSVLAHNGRSVRCATCKTAMDRDFNAAMNIATLKHLRFPPAQRTTGDDCTISEVVADRPSSSAGTRTSGSLVGNTT